MTTKKTTRPASRKGRKSTAQKVAEKLRPNKSDHFPPDTLSERATQIWCQVVDTLPDNHFMASDLQLLSEYCETAAVIERIRSRWNGEATIIKQNGDELVSPTLTAITRNQSTLAALASKLRICPSSRMSSSKAGHEIPKSKHSKRDGLMR